MGRTPPPTPGRARPRPPGFKGLPPPKFRRRSREKFISLNFFANNVPGKKRLPHKPKRLDKQIIQSYRGIPPRRGCQLFLQIGKKLITRPGRPAGPQKRRADRRPGPAPGQKKGPPGYLPSGPFRCIRFRLEVVVTGEHHPMVLPEVIDFLSVNQVIV
jgi:hypothetical protein